MSGRGTRFRAVFQEAGAKDQVFEIEVARHAPLSIVKEQMQARLSGRSLSEMNVVLQSSDDPEDGTLLDQDDASVYEMGIRSGSTVWVNFLQSPGGCDRSPARAKLTPSPPISPVLSASDGGAANESPVPADAAEDLLAAAERRAREHVRAWLEAAQADQAAERYEQEKHRLEALERSGVKANGAAPGPVHDRTVARDVIIDTPVQPRQADHSYNGVVFDVRANSAHELVINSIWLGGMLGTVRVFAMLSGPWHQGQFEHKIRRCGWNNYNDVLDRSDWEEVGCQHLPAAWDSSREVQLSKPVRIGPGETRGFYVHSGLPGACATCSVTHHLRLSIDIVRVSVVWGGGRRPWNPIPELFRSR